MRQSTPLIANTLLLARGCAAALIVCLTLCCASACGGESDAPNPDPSQRNPRGGEENTAPDDQAAAADGEADDGDQPEDGGQPASESEGEGNAEAGDDLSAELAAMRYIEPKDGEDALHVRFEGGIRAIVDSPDERVEVLAEMLGGVSRPLEFLVVAPGGASHEALLQMRGRPFDLHQALELIGLVPAAEDEKLSFRGDSTVPKGDPVALSVVWTADDGQRFETPISRWVYNSDTQSLVTPGPWVFSGSIEQYQPELERSLYLANQVSNVIGLWRDPSCVLDNPRPSGVQDMIFRVSPDNRLMPGQYREVTLVLRAWPESSEPQE